MKFYIIGSGAFGINIAYQLLLDGHTVTMITDNLNSISSIYAGSISLDNPSYSWLSQIYFENKNYNYLWLLIYLICILINKNNYVNYKKYIIKKTVKILDRYNINYNKCNNKYLINFNKIHKEMLKKMLNFNNFKIIKKYIHDKDIKKLSLHCDYIFNCCGSNNKKSFLDENIGGYLIIIKSKNNKCIFARESGWFIHSEQFNPNILYIKGGFIKGSSIYEKNITNTEESKKIINIIKKKPFWKKYNCQEVLHTRFGTRMYSIDMLPYYDVNKNIINVMGGSAIGCILSPYISHCIVDSIVYKRNNSPIDFTYNRPLRLYRLCLATIFVILTLLILIIMRSKM